MRRLLTSTVVLTMSVSLLAAGAPGATAAAAPSSAVPTNFASWGADHHGQTRPPLVAPGTRYTRIAAGIMHSLAVTEDGELIAWGRNEYRQADVPEEHADTVLSMPPVAATTRWR